MEEQQNVGNFQIQYFPNWAKVVIDAIAAENNVSRKELFVALASNREKFTEFLKNAEILKNNS